MAATTTPVADSGHGEAAEAEQRATPLELFFDLVFVFAITQVTGYLADELTWTRFAEGLAILVVLWQAWSCYAWLGNTAGSDEGLIRLVLLSAMAAMLIASLAVPHAFGRDALVFGVAYAFVRVLHIVAYLVLARGDAGLHRVTVVLARSMLPPTVLLVIAGVTDGTTQALMWAAAIAIDVGGLTVFGVAGWRVQASHFAERHALIIIIALGESVVSVGVGASEVALDAGVIAAALAGIAAAGAMWWAYFDMVAIVAERRFRTTSGDERARMARDSYTYLHLPMVAGIVLFALGVKKTVGHVGEPLDTVPAVALCGGAALYLLAHVAFRLRNVHTLNRQRLVAAVACALLTFAAVEVDALVALAVVTAVLVVLIAYERVRYAAFRDRLRHEHA